MGDNAWTVVKIGGSLFDLPNLRQRLPAWLMQLGAANVLLVPGGGATADAIRVFDRVQELGEEASHWLALQALSLNARFVQELLPTARIVAEIPEPDAQAREAQQSRTPRSRAGLTSLFLLDAAPFFQADERRPDHLPHRWHVSSDSLAVRAAILADAHELILLKSITWEESDWTEASRSGIVDGFFADAMRAAPAGMRVRIMNLRTWRDGMGL